MIPIEITDVFTATDNTPASGFVDFLLTAPLTSATTGVRVAAAPVTAPLDDTGAISILLFSTDDPADWPGTDPVYYIVTEVLTGQAPTPYAITVPATAPAGTIPLGLCPRRP